MAKTDFDFVIIGGGPGGLSAAVWCYELGLKSILLEREAELGGQLLKTFGAITNFLGREAQNGRELCEHFLAQLDRTDVTCITNAEIETADLASMSVTMSDGAHISSRSIMIATGVRRRKLDVPGASEFEGRGILSSGAASTEDVRGRSVVIVGGGDAAIENALILSRSARKVTVVHRGSNFTARRDLVGQIGDAPNIDVHMESTVRSINGNTSVEGVMVENKAGSLIPIAAENVLIRIGVVPNSEPFAGQVAVDHQGYIIIDHLCRTDMHGVFAVGDVANPVSPTISTSIGNGATAIKTALTLIRGSKNV